MLLPSQQELSLQVRHLVVNFNLLKKDYGIIKAKKMFNTQDQISIEDKS